MQHKKLWLAFTILIAAGVYGYVVFSNYKPKDLVQLAEVRGDKSDKSNSLDLPYPEKAERISITKTSGSEQVTFKTEKNKEEVQEYYKNVMATLNWKLESEAIYDYSTVSRFYKDESRVNVMAFDEESSTGSLVGIEISKH
ncbi:hypothetical protein GYA27_04180 [candidate division WWE3 bacterium]|uniref:Uncharacterized protein n=1 Tax=candidate division WWE3 bacterium TaxID=2053526 RepID=A0A7X9DKX4_UNCKA|nr:hypothetical protein [candidate division WWE3 bacterium]